MEAGQAAAMGKMPHRGRSPRAAAAYWRGRHARSKLVYAVPPVRDRLCRVVAVAQTAQPVAEPMHVRGGSWNNNLRNDRAANRNNNTPDNRNNNLGFRLAKTPRKPEPASLRRCRACRGVSRAGHDELLPAGSSHDDPEVLGEWRDRIATYLARRRLSLHLGKTFVTSTAAAAPVLAGHGDGRRHALLSSFRLLNNCNRRDLAQRYEVGEGLAIYPPECFRLALGNDRFGADGRRSRSEGRRPRSAENRNMARA
jgi:hypothetical protein